MHNMVLPFMRNTKRKRQKNYSDIACQIRQGDSDLLCAQPSHSLE